MFLVSTIHLWGSAAIPLWARNPRTTALRNREGRRTSEHKLLIPIDEFLDSRHDHAAILLGSLTLVPKSV